MTHDHAEDVALCDAALRCPQLGADRADRVGGEVGAVPPQARRAGPRRRRDRPDHHARSGCPTSPARNRRRSRSASPPASLRDANASAAPSPGAVRGDALPGHRPRHAGRPVRRRRRSARRGRRRLLVRDGVIVARGAFADATRRSTRDEEVVDLRGGLCCPGFVDTHVHFPQVRAIGGLGMPLLDWLERCALPEEARLADPAYARGGRGVRRRPGSAGHHHGAGLRRPLRPRGRRAVRRGRAQRAAGHQRPGGQRPAPARRPADHPGSGPTPRVARWPDRWHGVGRQPVRRDPAVLAVLRRRDARRLCGRC